MSTTVLEETVKAEGYTLSQIIWRLLKRQPDTYLETVLAYNTGLADLGYQIPVGTVVKIPLDEIPSEDEQSSDVDVVNLWD